MIIGLLVFSINNYINIDLSLKIQEKWKSKSTKLLLFKKFRNYNQMTQIDSLIEDVELNLQNLKLEYNSLRDDSSTNFTLDFQTNPKDIIIRIGILRFDYKISTNTTYQEFNKFIRSVISKSITNYGFEFQSNFIVSLNNESDLTFMFNWYLSNKPQFLHIVSIPKSSKLLIRPDKLFHQENAIPILYVPVSEQKKIGYFIPIPFSISITESVNFFKSFDSSVRHFSFSDSEGDQIKITNNDEWDYFLSESISHFRKGKYIVLHGFTE